MDREKQAHTWFCKTTVKICSPYPLLSSTRTKSFRKKPTSASVGFRRAISYLKKHPQRRLLMTFEATLGLDLSKSHFTVSLISSDEKFNSTPKYFKRSKEGIEDLLNWLKKHNFSPSQVLVVMESSNNFWERLFFLLVEAGIQVSVVNPRPIKRFCQVIEL